MTRFTRLGWYAVLLLLGVLLPAIPCHAQYMQDASASVRQTITLDEKGAAQIDTTISFSPVRVYDRIKRARPNLYVLFRDFNNERSSTEIVPDTLSITTDDQKRTINFKATMLGYAVCRQDRWLITVEDSEELITQIDNRLITSSVNKTRIGWLTASTINTTTVYVLPKTAQYARLEKDQRLIIFTLPQQPKVTDAKCTVDMNVRTKNQLMSSAYKIYSNPDMANGAYWIAKTIIKNTGTAPISNVRISYKLGEYSESDVPHAYSIIPSGGGLVDCYYPVISSRVTNLRTGTPCTLSVLCTYTDPLTGKDVTMTDDKRLEITGVNQFYFSNLNEKDMTDSWYDAYNNIPLLAAFVTYRDDAVKQFGGLVSKCSGGTAGAMKDAEAYRWLATAYELLSYNGVAYQTPSTFLKEGSLSGQDIKFPRDVFRDKAGTCVDLATTIAALGESTGIHSMLLVVPGHAMPVFVLPSGRLLPIETTGISSGKKSHLSFSQAVAYGWGNMRGAYESGIGYLIDVPEELSNGVPNPELSIVDADYLTKCDITDKGFQSLKWSNFIF